MLIFMMIFMTFGVSRVKAKTQFYGTVYIFGNIERSWWGLSCLVPQHKPERLNEFFNLNPIVLMNKGNTKSVNFMLPYNLSNIEIVYDNQIYRFPLKFYKKLSNCLIYTFSGS